MLVYTTFGATFSLQWKQLYIFILILNQCQGFDYKFIPRTIEEENKS